MSSRKPFAALDSPQAWSLFYRAVGIFFGVALSWLLLVAILSLFNAWLIISLTIGLGVYVYARDRAVQRRAMRIELGYCADCGNPLPSPPGICSVCGRDGSNDEPTWRKLRRDHETRKATLAANGGVVSQMPIPVIPLPRPVRRVLPEDDGPIPLEPLNPPTTPPEDVGN